VLTRSPVQLLSRPGIVLRRRNWSQLVLPLYVAGRKTLVMAFAPGKTLELALCVVCLATTTQGLSTLSHLMLAKLHWVDSCLSTTDCLFIVVSIRNDIVSLAWSLKPYTLTLFHVQDALFGAVRPGRMVKMDSSMELTRHGRAAPSLSALAVDFQVRLGFLLRSDSCGSSSSA
jgi:hypothetical protein